MEKVKYFGKTREYTMIANWETLLHRHSFWEIIICMQGSACHTINGKEYHFSAGDLIIMKPESTHMNTVKDLKEYISFDFYANFVAMKQACDDIAPNIYEQLISDIEPICLNPGKEFLSFIKNKLFYLYTIQINRNDKDITLAVYNTLLRLICGIAVEHTLVSNEPKKDNISKLLAKMNCPNVICSNIDYIVKISNYTHNYLCALFKKHTGMRLIDYLTRLKMEHAIHLMRDSDLKITEISSKLGYSSTSHFISVFKKIHRATPKQYRKRLQDSDKI